MVSLTPCGNLTEIFELVPKNITIMVAMYSPFEEMMLPMVVYCIFLSQLTLTDMLRSKIKEIIGQKCLFIVLNGVISNFGFPGRYKIY